MKPNIVKALLVLNDDTMEKLAEAMNITLRSLQMKVSGKCQFKLNELIIMKERYHLTPEQMDEYFFSNQVS